jgi:hypothetical protein
MSTREDYAVECLAGSLQDNGLDGVLTTEQISVVAKEMAEGLSMWEELGTYHPDRPSKDPEVERLEKKVARLEEETRLLDYGWRTSIASRLGIEPERVRIVDPKFCEYEWR